MSITLYSTFHTSFALCPVKINVNHHLLSIQVLSYDSLLKGKNVLVDGSLRNAHWYLEYFRNLREKFPIIKIGTVHHSSLCCALDLYFAVRCVLVDHCHNVLHATKCAL